MSSVQSVRVSFPYGGAPPPLPAIALHNTIAKNENKAPAQIGQIAPVLKISISNLKPVD